jgi:hypothetical protein
MGNSDAWTWVFIFGCAVAAWIIGFGTGYRKGVRDTIKDEILKAAPALRRESSAGLLPRTAEAVRVYPEFRLGRGDGRLDLALIRVAQPPLGAAAGSLRSGHQTPCRITVVTSGASSILPLSVLSGSRRSCTAGNRSSCGTSGIHGEPPCDRLRNAACLVARRLLHLVPLQQTLSNSCITAGDGTR